MPKYKRKEWNEMKYKRNQHDLKVELKEQRLRTAQREKIKQDIMNLLIDFKMATTHNRIYDYRQMILKGHKGVAKTKVRELMKQFDELQARLRDEKNTFEFYRYSEYDYSLEVGKPVRQHEVKHMRQEFIEKCEEITTAIMELTFKFEEE